MHKRWALLLVFGGISLANINNIALEPLTAVKMAVNPVYQSAFLSNAIVAQNRVLTIRQKSFDVVVTAYSSAPEETDDTPFLTAAGTYVRPGVAAANFLPIGTQFRVPELFGERIFIVEDRMHERYKDRIDIWFNSLYEAQEFGRKVARIELL